MTIADLFSKALDTSVDRMGIDLMRDQMSEGARRGLAEMALGKIVVSLGQAVSDNPWLATPVVEGQRKILLTRALREVVTLLVLYGVAAEDIPKLLETGG